MTTKRSSSTSTKISPSKAKSTAPKRSSHILYPPYTNYPSHPLHPMLLIVPREHLDPRYAPCVWDPSRGRNGTSPTTTKDVVKTNDNDSKHSQFDDTNRPATSGRPAVVSPVLSTEVVEAVESLTMLGLDLRTSSTSETNSDSDQDSS
eukprot:g14504.t1 g14504   contig9:1975894-1976421(-)